MEKDENKEVENREGKESNMMESWRVTSGNRLQEKTSNLCWKQGG